MNNATDFVYWLQGFVEIANTDISQKSNGRLLKII